MRFLFALWASFLGLFLGLLSLAWGACTLTVAEGPGPYRLVSLAQAGPGEVVIRRLGHSSFLIETPGGGSAITDYNDAHRASYPPDVATMSNSHHLHSSFTLDEALTRAFRGWDPKGGLSRVDARVKDLHLFSVPTNISEVGGVKTNTNSIFVVEVARLCIAHLGNLTHLLNREQLDALGRIDVLFISIDGSWTLRHQDALTVIRQIGPALVIPMQYDMRGQAERFAEEAKEKFPVRVHTSRTLVVSRKTLPPRTEILFLEGE